MANSKKSKEEISTPTKLIVVSAFGNYRRGDAITDKNEIVKALQSHARCVHVIKSA